MSINSIFKENIDSAIKKLELSLVLFLINFIIVFAVSYYPPGVGFFLYLASFGSLFYGFFILYGLVNASLPEQSLKE